MAHIVIAGGGIAGLATALALTAPEQGRPRHHVTVLEREQTFTELGAGIQLAPNALHALNELGVADAVLPRAVQIRELRMMDIVDGNPIATLPLDRRYQDRFGAPYVVAHRTDLYQPLIEACWARPAVTLLPGNPVVGYQQDTKSVVAVLADGARITGDALVGADGIRSAIRRQMLRDGDPKTVGHTTYRSVIPIERVPLRLEPDVVTLWAGPRRHFVHYLVAGGRLLTIAVTVDNGATSAVSGAPVPATAVLASLGTMPNGADELLRIGTEWRSWTPVDRDPVDRWSDGRVILVGDAAHPMLQYAAQGACIALEDAVALGAFLSMENPDFTAALARFSETQAPRAGRVQRLARALCTEVYHPLNDAAQDRNARLRAMTTTGVYEALDWLHGGPDNRIA